MMLCLLPCLMHTPCHAKASNAAVPFNFGYTRDVIPAMK
jgi:hypothetical protein